MAAEAPALPTAAAGGGAAAGRLFEAASASTRVSRPAQALVDSHIQRREDAWRVVESKVGDKVKIIIAEKCPVREVEWIVVKEVTTVQDLPAGP